MPNVDDRSAMNAVWQSYYPDENNRPPNKYAPAALPDGHLVRLHLMAVPGSVSRTLEIPGLKHQDWMSMGALTGNLLTSSRLFGSHAFNKGRAKDEIEATELAFAHATTLLGQGGGNWSKIAQVSAFIGDPNHRAPVLAAWKKATQGNSNAPRLNIVEWQWGAAGTPRIEIVAIL
jgi:enamine deaminase RidA (YjgF/YER057c/UK114 family)